MSSTTCARSGAAYLFMCGSDQELRWPLALMQRDLDEIAAGLQPAPARADFVRPAQGYSHERLRIAKRKSSLKEKA